MCEFVCQISILISVAAIVGRKVFLLRESPLDSQSSPGRRWQASSHLHAPKCSGGGAWGFAPDQCRVAESSWWPRFLSPSPPFLSSSYGGPRLVQAAVWPLIPHQADFRGRELGEKPPTKPSSRTLHVQPSRWTLHSGDKVQPAWAFLLRPKKCPASARKGMSPEAQLFKDPPSSSNNSSTPLKQRRP